MLTAAFVLLTCFGVGLLLIGWRGRRIDDHPRCRRCRFDLTGRTPVPERCPECGASLSGRRRVRHGLHRRRPAMLAFGLVATVVGIGLFGAQQWGPLRQFDWNTVKPVWLLTDAARADDAAALNELLRRLSAGRLSPAQRDELVARAFARQADTARPWSTVWGDVIECTAFQGGLSDADLATYLERALGASIVMPERSISGDEVTSRLVFDGRSASPSLFEIDFRWEYASVDGVRSAIEQSLSGQFSLASPPLSAVVMSASAFAEPGPVEFEAAARLYVVPHATNAPEYLAARARIGRGWRLGGGTSEPPPSNAAHEILVVGKRELTLEPRAGFRLAEGDSAIWDELRKVFAPVGVVSGGAVKRLQIMTTNVTRLEVAFSGAFRMTVRIGDETYVTDRDLDARLGRLGVMTRIQLALEPGDTFDLILEPNHERWLAVGGTEPVPAGSLVFEDVEVIGSEGYAARVQASLPGRRTARPAPAAPRVDERGADELLALPALDRAASRRLIDIVEADGADAAERIAEVALARHRNAAASWTREWADVLDAALAREGLVTAEERDRFIERALGPVDVRVRAVAAPDGQVPVEIALDIGRATTGRRFNPHVVVAAHAVLIDDVPAEMTVRPLATRLRDQMPVQLTKRDGHFAAPTGLGRYDVIVRGEIFVMTEDAFLRGLLEAGAPDPPGLLLRRPFEASGNFRVTETGVELVRLVPGAPANGLIAGDARLDLSHPDNVRLSIDLTQEPDWPAVVARAAVTIGERTERSRGAVAIGGERLAGRVDLEFAHQPTWPDTVTLTLLPAPDVAGGFVDLVRIVGEPIVIRDIPVAIRRSDGS